MKKGSYVTISPIDLSAAYLHGSIDKEITLFANAIGVLPGDLTFRLGELLSSNTSRIPMGIENRVPKLPAKTAGRPKGSTKMEMVVSPSSPASSVKKGLSKQQSAQQAYWANMSPLQRKREIARRIAKRAA